MKYRTFGELLTFIRGHLEQCENEKVHFAIEEYTDTDGGRRIYMTAAYFVTRMFTIELMNSLVTGIELDYLAGQDPKLLIKVLI